MFLHPKTKDEYALARQERKTGPGYHGFEFNTQSTVTLEEDLLRRDLTINAVAEDENGKLIDPYGGIKDIEQKILRHVSKAFMEDPVRILRVARFSARFHHLGFTIAPETKVLMYQMVKAGEVDNLVPERVWSETSRALTEKTPAVFFEVLRQIGALKILFPELDALFGVPQTVKWHGEIDCGVHTLMVLTEARKLCDDHIVCFAALTHDLGKATTPIDIWPSHHGHEKKGLKPLDRLVKRMGVPKEHRDLARLVTEYHTHVHKVQELTTKRLVKLVDELDVYRKPQRFKQFVYACRADAFGRIGGDGTYPQADYLERAYEIVAQVTFTDIDVPDGATGNVIKQALSELRIKRINEWLEKNNEA